jgi:putative endonuclease
VLKDFLSNKNLRQKSGKAAEREARNFLENQGLKFLQSNFHCRFGEVDLIFKDKEILVFVEVRYRKRNDFGSSLETINRSKQQKIIKAAEYYLFKKQLTESVNCRFDVIGMQPKNNTIPSDSNEMEYQVQWIKNAFS